MASTNPHIFISYARNDKATAKLLAEALANQGLSVWWDRDILPGEAFAETIEQALDSAACVVVLWSKTSVASGWVKTEAAEGLSRRILIPALIEDVKIPLEFRRIETANLSDWQGSPAHHEYCEMVNAIGRMIRKRDGGEITKTTEPEVHEEEEARTDAVESSQIVPPMPIDRGQREVLTLPNEEIKTSIVTPARIAVAVAVVAIVVAGVFVVWLMQSNGDERATNAPPANSNQLVASTVSGPTPTPTPARPQSSRPQNDRPLQGAPGTGNSNANVPGTREPARNTNRVEERPSPSPSRTREPDNDRPRAPISGGVLNGKAISLPQPAYPPTARAAHASGTVIVQVLIDEEGSVISASALSGHPLLINAAVNAARHAKFNPTKLSGQPVRVSGVIQYNFVPQ